MGSTSPSADKCITHDLSESANISNFTRHFSASGIMQSLELHRDEKVSKGK